MASFIDFVGADFTSLAPNSVNLESLEAELEALSVPGFDGLIRTSSSEYPVRTLFTGDVPTGSGLTTLQGGIAAYTGAVFLTVPAKFTKIAVFQTSEGTFQSALTTPWTPGPLAAGEWRLDVSALFYVDNIGHSAAGPTRACIIRLMRDGVEIIRSGNPFEDGIPFPFGGSDVHFAGDNPAFDIQIRRKGAGASELVFVEKIRMFIAPVSSFVETSE